MSRRVSFLRRSIRGNTRSTCSRRRQRCSRIRQRLAQARSDLARYQQLRAQKAIAEQTVTDQEFIGQAGRGAGQVR